MKDLGPFIHSGNSNKKIILNYILALLPLIIFGFYKNGIFLYNKELISLLDMFKPIYLPFLGAFIFFIVDYIYSLIKKEKYSITENFNILYGLILGMIVQPRISVIVFIITLIICAVLFKLLSRFKNLNINSVAITKIIISLIVLRFSTGSYQNIYENKVLLDYSVFDMFFGKSVGGIDSTNVFLCIISYLFLSSTKLYKKEIPFYLITTYSLINIIFAFLIKDYSIVINNLLGNTFIFASVFIAPNIINTPKSIKGKKLFGVLLAIIMLFSSIFIKSDAIYIAIVITSLLTPVIDKKYS